VHTDPFSSQTHLRERNELIIRLTQRGVLDEVALCTVDNQEYNYSVTYIAGGVRGLNLIALSQ
jgi:hypothetical protein